MDRNQHRTLISIEEQPQLDFEEAENSHPFTFPEYQRGLISHRIIAGLTDFGIVGAIYLVFVLATIMEMPDAASADRTVLGVYLAGFLLLVAVYFLLFMLSASQTPGMKSRQLIAVTRYGEPLDPRSACMRGFGYFISLLPIMLGFVWAVIDPEHLTWADKVSGTYIRKV
jgi:uncharacterized RDD family membrane protein YckC